MSIERGEDKLLDIIRWMGKVSSDESGGVIFRVGLEITGGHTKGQFVEITAPTYSLGDGRFVIVERGIPILARHIPLNNIPKDKRFASDSMVRRLKKVTKDQKA